MTDLLPGAALSARAVAKSFALEGGARVDVLRGIDIDVAPGEMVSIVGPSGSGKSTLLYCLAGLERADAGAIAIGQERIDRASHARLARLRRDSIGFVFQSYNLIPSLNVQENVALPSRLARRRRPDTASALAAVGMTGHERKRPGALSGGQQQRVAIARVLAAEPPLVFADEPTGALDTAAGERVLDLLRQYAHGDRSVVLVTHDLDAAARADRTVVLRDGAVVEVLRRASAAQILAATQETVGSVPDRGAA